MAAVTQLAQFETMQVYDLDFTASTTIVIVHSFETTLLYVSIIAIDDSHGPSIPPAVVFNDDNQITLTSDSSATGTLQFRLYLSVVPQ
jgi:hypothetical protein